MKVFLSFFWGFEVVTICWESVEMECLMLMLCPGLLCYNILYCTCSKPWKTAIYSVKLKWCLTQLSSKYPTNILSDSAEMETRCPLLFHRYKLFVNHWAELNLHTDIPSPVLVRFVRFIKIPMGFFYPDDEVPIQTDEKEWDVLVFHTHTYILKRVR